MDTYLYPSWREVNGGSTVAWLASGVIVQLLNRGVTWKQMLAHSLNSVIFAMTEGWMITERIHEYAELYEGTAEGSSLSLSHISAPSVTPLQFGSVTAVDIAPQGFIAPFDRLRIFLAEIRDRVVWSASYDPND